MRHHLSNVLHHVKKIDTIYIPNIVHLIESQQLLENDDYSQLKMITNKYRHTSQNKQEKHTIKNIFIAGYIKFHQKNNNEKYVTDVVTHNLLYCKKFDDMKSCIENISDSFTNVFIKNHLLKIDNEQQLSDYLIHFGVYLYIHKNDYNSLLNTLCAYDDVILMEYLLTTSFEKIRYTLFPTDEMYKYLYGYNCSDLILSFLEKKGTFIICEIPNMVHNLNYTKRLRLLYNGIVLNNLKIVEILLKESVFFTRDDTYLSEIFIHLRDNNVIISKEMFCYLITKINNFNEDLLQSFKYLKSHYDVFDHLLQHMISNNKSVRSILSICMVDGATHYEKLLFEKKYQSYRDKYLPIISQGKNLILIDCVKKNKLREFIKISEHLGFKFNVNNYELFILSYILNSSITPYIFSHLAQPYIFSYVQFIMIINRNNKNCKNDDNIFSIPNDIVRYIIGYYSTIFWTMICNCPKPLQSTEWN